MDWAIWIYFFFVGFEYQNADLEKPAQTELKNIAKRAQKTLFIY